MDSYRIRGGKPLYGSARVQGSKNAALPILAAALLSREGCRVENCPHLTDVEAALAILRALGCKTVWSGQGLELDASKAAFSPIGPLLTGRMRASVLFLGPMLARFGQAELALPGGCRLGERPVDLHLLAMRSLGAEVREEPGRLICRAEGLRGGVIRFPFPSVGATENALLAAVTAEGETLLFNPAREPEIAELISFLRAMGARIDEAEDGALLRVQGVKSLGEARHRVMPDRIDAATLLCAAAGCGGRVEVENCLPGQLEPVLKSLAEMGCRIETVGDRVCLTREGALYAPKPVVTGPYPAFPTDAQPLLMAACLRAEGISRFEETVFSKRFAHASEMAKLGARIRVEGRKAEIRGVRRLRGAALEARDLRGGAALLLAALQAEGESRLSGTAYMDRGYEALAPALAGLGAEIERKEGTPSEQQEKRAAPQEKPDL